MAAISNYGVDMVVANILKKRRFEVTIFEKSGEKKKLTVDEDTKQVDEISKQIVKYIRDTLGITKKEE